MPVKNWFNDFLCSPGNANEHKTQTKNNMASATKIPAHGVHGKTPKVRKGTLRNLKF